MRKKQMVPLLTAVISCSLVFGGCGREAAEAAGNAAQDGQKEQASESGESDQEAADRVAALIDAIYVQQRTQETDQQCASARAAWDELTDAQKELVEGENADFDYFGRDTGDASRDDPRNQDGIGENEILVVSFGTSFNDSRADDICGIEDAIQKANPDWSVRRAFTAQIIINHIQARDGELIDNMDQALARAVSGGVKNLVIQPTHLMHGAEYDELMESVAAYQDQFETVKVAEPLLGQVGEDAEEVNRDKERVAESLTEAAVQEAGYGSLEEAREDGTAFVFMGHGTSHAAKVSYSQMQTQMGKLGYDNVFIGTVEGEPEDTSCEAVIEAVAGAGYGKVVLRPLMVVAGDHAHNDMAGEDEDSWLSKFRASGSFDQVEVQIRGLGSIAAIQELYVEHTAEAMKGASLSAREAAGDAPLRDGVYTAEFHTDNSMFHVSEACDGKGTLTVKDGEMLLHISLGSKNIVNLYLGSAADAAKEGAKLLSPTEDTVTYSDGTTEQVYGFDVPVPVLEEEFDLALLGTKGTWYDHKVRVSHPAALTGTADGTYQVGLTLEGGTGKATVASPAELLVKDGAMTAILVWSSPNYDYMVVDGEKYLPVNTEGNSTFEIPVTALDQEIPVIADTVAMSTPHEVEYTLTFHSDTMTERG